MKRFGSGVIAFLCLAILGMAEAQSSGDAQKCMDERAPDLVINYCGRVIRSGQPSISDRSNAHLARGRAYFARGAYDRAIQDFDSALRLSPSFTDVYSARGAAYIRKGQPDRAIQDLDQAIRANPDFADALNNRGLAYLA